MAYSTNVVKLFRSSNMNIIQCAGTLKDMHQLTAVMNVLQLLMVYMTSIHLSAINLRSVRINVNSY